MNLAEAVMSPFDWDAPDMAEINRRYTWVIVKNQYLKLFESNSL